MQPEVLSIIARVDPLLRSAYDFPVVEAGEEVNDFFGDAVRSHESLHELREFIRGRLERPGSEFYWNGGNEVDALVEGFSVALLAAGRQVDVTDSTLHELDRLITDAFAVDAATNGRHKTSRSFYKPALRGRPELKRIVDHIRVELKDPRYDFSHKSGNEVEAFIEGFIAGVILLERTQTNE